MVAGGTSGGSADETMMARDVSADAAYCGAFEAALRFYQCGQ